MAARIGIYNRWLHVLGGGERYVGALAAGLARKHDVVVLTHHPVDRGALERSLELDLSRVTITTLPYCPSYRPIQEASAGFDLFVNGSHRDFFVPRARASAMVVFFPAAPDSATPPIEYPRWLRPRRLLGRRWLRRRLGPERAGLVLDRPAEHLATVLESYQILLAISEYSRDWTRRLWRRESRLLYPPVQVQRVRVGQKRRQILSVGRFFPGQHNKKHLEMISAFKGLVDEGLPGWEYHLVGGLKMGEASHDAYLRAARRAAEGYPIRFHVNAPRETVNDLYAQSRVFWHATGFGEDAEVDPELFEHFGLVTVEAMAAGCVPLVFGRAGQVEIVVDGESGLFWSTLGQLRASTRRVAEAPDFEASLSAGARTRSRAFGDDVFATRAESILAPMLEGR
jgi:glycosyltransferase involved in cell wall biosynthesis